MNTKSAGLQSLKASPPFGEHTGSSWIDIRTSVSRSAVRFFLHW